MKKKILISSGGSGGHVIPATIFYDHLKDNYDVFITTDKRGNKFINKSKYKNIIFNTPNLSKNTFLLPFNLLIIFLLVIKSIIYLKKNKVNYFLNEGKKYFRRKDYPKESFFINGSIFITNKKNIENKKLFNFKNHGIYFTSKISSFDLNDYEDLKIIKKIIS